jgi:hypothetical protein
MYADCRATLASPAAGIADGDAAHRRCVLSGITSLKPRVCQLGRLMYHTKRCAQLMAVQQLLAPTTFVQVSKHI